MFVYLISRTILRWNLNTCATYQEKCFSPLKHCWLYQDFRSWTFVRLWRIMDLLLKLLSSALVLIIFYHERLCNSSWKNGKNLHFKKISPFVRFWKCLSTIPNLNVCAPLKKFIDCTKIFDPERSCGIWILVQLIWENVYPPWKILENTVK